MDTYFTKLNTKGSPHRQAAVVVKSKICRYLNSVRKGRSIKVFRLFQIGERLPLGNSRSLPSSKFPVPTFDFSTSTTSSLRRSDPRCGVAAGPQPRSKIFPNVTSGQGSRCISQYRYNTYRLQITELQIILTHTNNIAPYIAHTNARLYTLGPYVRIGTISARTTDQTRRCFPGHLLGHFLASRSRPRSPPAANTYYPTWYFSSRTAGFTDY